MLTPLEPWFDVNELPDDQFCDDCIAAHVPDQFIPALLQSWDDEDDVPSLPELTYFDFPLPRRSCCFCRLLSHMISPDKLRHGDVGVRFYLDTPILFEKQLILSVFPFQLSDGESAAEYPCCGAIKVSEDQERLSSSTDVDYESIKRLVFDCEEGSGDCQECDTTLSRPHSSTAITLIDVTHECIVPATSEARYLALSYVWGDVEMFSLTSENRARLQVPGSLCSFYSLIPQTILDAMAFTRNLGERYLWVDVLCIEQDDISKRSEQIRQMHIIYSSAVLAIIAFGPPDATQGLPGVRPGTMLPIMSQKIMGTRFESTFENSWRLTDSMEDTSKYLTRAWTLQEYLLSPRSIIFGYRETIFVCSHSEPRGITGKKYDSSGLKPLYGRILMKKWTSRDLDEGLELYEALVRAYTKKDLSHHSDRLYAFSGCLSQLQPAIGQCVQGLPTANFARALLWSARLPRDLDTAEWPLPPPRGPPRRMGMFSSWSWADWDDSAEYSMLEQEVRMMIQDIEVSSQSHPERLRLRGVDNDNIPEPLVSNQPGLGLTIYFEARVCSASAYRAKEPEGLISDYVTVSLYDAADKLCGGLFGMEAETYNEVALKTGEQRCELILMGLGWDSYSTYSEKTKYKTEEWNIAEVLMIQWMGETAIRLATGRIHIDAFEEAGPKTINVSLR